MRNFNEELNNLLSKENVLNALDEIDKLTEEEINQLLDYVLQQNKALRPGINRIALRSEIEDISPRDRLKEEIRRGIILQ